MPRLYLRAALSCLFVAGLIFPAAVQAATPTTTLLSIDPADRVHARQVISLTAAVSTSSGPLAHGWVFFCNADARHCDELNNIGQAQLTNDGKAVLRTRLAIGTHTLKAVFHGTTAGASSTSHTQKLEVFGKEKTFASISVSQDARTYTGTIDSLGFIPALGDVEFHDVADPDHPFAEATLNPAKPGFLSINLAPFDPSVTTQQPAPAVGDFNNDGIPDLATFLFIAGKPFISVEFGVGDGTFKSGPKSPIPNLPTQQDRFIRETLITDFNADGNADMLLLTGGFVTALLGDGNGNFTQKFSFPGENSQGEFAAVIGDFNNDGIPDVAIADASPGTALNVYLGAGDGSFDNPSTLTLPQNTLGLLGLEAADFNRDGFTDLLVPAFGDGQFDLIYTSDGKGGFTASEYAPPPALNGERPMIADYNVDGIPDLGFEIYYVVGQKSTTLLFIVPGKGDGTFGTSILTDLTHFEAAGLQPPPIGSGVMTDFNHDGIPDFIFIVFGYFNDPSEGQINVQYPLYLEGRGDGTFLPPRIGSIGEAPGYLPQSEYILLAPGADFNGDGTPDFINQNGPQTLLTTTETQAVARNVHLLSCGEHHVFASHRRDDWHRGSQSEAVSVSGPCK